MSDSFDAIVIGGGPAGSTTGLLLAKAGWRVVLLERKPFPRRKVCGEYLSATNLTLLRHLGLQEAFFAKAGPPVVKVGLFAGSAILEADLPKPVGPGQGWGRALARAVLDTWLLETASREGLEVWQPWAPIRLERRRRDYFCLARSSSGAGERLLRAPIVVAAHGSWEPGPLPTQPKHADPKPGDLLGFKAHFQDSRLPPGLMPLLAFPDGYGGMVHCDSERISLSCCLRRDRLTRLARHPNQAAGDAVLNHILETCPAARLTLDGAIRQGDWLAAGPIRPGIHLQAPPGLFRVGNAAGEAHPVVAEGISMAMQGAWLLSQCLKNWRQAGGSTVHLGQAGAVYARTWQQHFSPRLHASTLIAHWAMRPSALALTLPLVRWFPRLLTLGARFAGKAKPVPVRES